MLKTGVALLGSRYKLMAGPILAEPISQSWLGVNEDDSKYLIKVWPFDGSRPDDLQRALWDAELRTLYRVGSSPGADDAILVIRDAGVDSAAHCFAMVLEAPGYESLATVIKDRSRSPWLQTKEPPVRRAIWAGLARLVDGVELLHEQHILHRDIRPETVYFSVDLGPSSFRLGGFEWSVRLGRPATGVPPASWSSPPEFFRGGAYGYRPETDWFGFGMLAARLLLNLESYASNEPVDRHARVLAEVERSGNKLADIERALLKRLIAADPRDRLSRGYEVSTAVADVVRALEAGGAVSEDGRPLVVVVSPTTTELVERAVELGFVPNQDNVHDSFNPQDLLQVSRLTAFIQRDLNAAQLYAVQNAPFYLLVGAQLVLRITQFEHTDFATGETTKNWDLAYCQGTGDLRWNEGGASEVDLPVEGVVVRSRRQVRDRAIRQNAKSWERYLPTVNRAIQLRANLARFHEFIRCTNQLELLIRDSELFRYRTVSRSLSDGIERLTIEEEERPRRPVQFAAIEGGLREFLSREIASNKPDCRLVVLTPASEDALILPQIQKSDRWTVEYVDLDTGRVQLWRVAVDGKQAEAPSNGVIRAWGMFGQVALIRRRKRAIDRIEKHA